MYVRTVFSAAVPGQPEAAMVGSKGTVSLDSRFDAGYFCTVKVGRLEFKGQLAAILTDVAVET